MAPNVQTIFFKRVNDFMNKNNFYCKINIPPKLKYKVLKRRKKSIVRQLGKDLSFKVLIQLLL